MQVVYSLTAKHRLAQERAASGGAAEASRSSGADAPGGASGEEVAPLREARAVAAKERAALLTILEAKVGPLVADIGRGLVELPEEVLLPRAGQTARALACYALLPLLQTY